MAAPKILWAALGGFVGSAARYAVSGGVYVLFPRGAFPVGTLAVNVLGCLCIGGLTAFAEGRGLLGPEARVFLRGIEGFGAHSRLHTAKRLSLSADLPIEIVDTREKIERFLPVIDAAIPEGLATIERVEIRFYPSGSGPAPDNAEGKDA